MPERKRLHRFGQCVVSTASRRIGPQRDAADCGWKRPFHDPIALPLAASALPRRRRRSPHEATEGLHANCTQAMSEAQRILEEYLEPDRTITSASLTGWLGC